MKTQSPRRTRAAARTVLGIHAALFSLALSMSGCEALMDGFEQELWEESPPTGSGQATPTPTPTPTPPPGGMIEVGVS